MSIEELSEYFYISNRKRHTLKIHVRINDEGIHLCRRQDAPTRQTDDECVIKIEDVFGSHCGPRLKKRARGGLSSCKRLVEEEQVADDDAQDVSAYLYIYAYVKRDNPLRRVRTERILRFRTYENYEENLTMAQRWQQLINTLRTRRRRRSSSRSRSRSSRSSSNHSESSDDENRVQQDRKEVLILLNPKSGSGKAREMFQKQVAPVLHEAQLSYELHVTKYANFARQFVRIKKDLLQCYRGIIVAAGDGLFYEVLNGLMERDDWQHISRHLPIGIIPCGSGNGLAATIAHLYQEPYEPKPILHATLTCASGHAAPMDVVRVEVTQNGRQTEMYSFLSVGWGLIADIDIESERLRSIGAPRFTLWSIRRVLSLRTYKGKVYYLSWQEKESQQEVQKVAASRSSAELHSRNRFDKNEKKSHDYDDHDDNIDDADDNDDSVADEFIDAVSLNPSSRVSHRDSWHSTMSSQTAFYSITGQSMRSQRSMASKIEVAAAAAEAAVYCATHRQGPAPTIPPLNMPLTTESWQCLEGEFIMVHAAYTTHLASACLFAPASRLNDGIIYLVIIRAGIGRSQLAQFLLNLSTGTHLPDQPNENIRILPVTAFRIEPNDMDGIITVDGERVEYGAIQGEILPGLIKVMVPKLMANTKDTHVHKEIRKEYME